MHVKSNSAITTEQTRPLQSLPGVGPQLAARLKKIGISDSRDLLYHLPLRYQDRTRVTSIYALEPGRESVVAGRIDAAEVRFGRRRSLLVGISDSTGSLLLRFFHFSHRQQRGFRQGAWIQCYGEPRRGSRAMEMIHPEYKILKDAADISVETSLTPVYPTTEGVGAFTIRKLAAQSLDRHIDDERDILPEAVRKEFGMMTLGDALKTVHRPPPGADTGALIEGVHPAQQRLAFEEMLAHHLALSQIRSKRKQNRAPPIAARGTSWDTLKSLLAFELTRAQNRVIEEIQNDMEKSHPAIRLIQGDVGCGKTIVAAAAALRAIDNGYQAALMAPTELLAEQHRKTFREWFAPLDVNIEWLTGKLKAAHRRAALERIENGAADLIIGTHALFQESVAFHNLGLMIVDEQHRFGVDQRLSLRNKGYMNDSLPHQIIMSATPIPRSLAMIMYADLDVSSIDELPPGRKTVNTVVLSSGRREEVADRIRTNCQQGRQAYWVCPLIEESDKLQAQAATKTCENLQSLLPRIRIGLIHGRLKPHEKETIMNLFSAGEIDLLVATTVIEVGVDVPNANLMVIENAERLGLAQLHQLRGRIGRGGSQASCVLMYQAPLNKPAKERLGILRNTADGFKIAQKDLEQRGPGELLGRKQTGLPQMRIADIARDKGMIPKAAQMARKLQKNHPELIPVIISRWIDNSDQYANV